MNTAEKGSKSKKKTTGTKKKATRKKALTYKDAGVDVEVGNEFVKRISSLVRKTFNSKVLTDIGGFSGLYNFDQAIYDQPVLVSSTDGVGTKLKLAFMADRHDTIGIDLVAMCVNDILVQGAKPLFFMDYLVVGKLDPAQGEKIIAGIVTGCREAGCALIGGETAEHPGLYKEGEYDLAGFVVGVVERDKIIDDTEVRVGDKIIGFGSSGLHSNGFSLVRKIIFDNLKLKINDKILDTTVTEELLRPTRIYVHLIQMLLRDFKINGIAHITGGGILENIPRVLPNTCQAVIDKAAWERPPIFSFLQEEGNVPENEMFRTFNMGLGMVAVTRASEADEILERLAGMNEPAWIVGEIAKRKSGRPALVLV